MPDLQKYYLFRQTETTMKTKPNPKLIAALAAIFAPPALVAFAWALTHTMLLRLLIVLIMLFIFSFTAYKATLWLMEHWDGFKEMVKDMWK